ncbi:protein XRP2 [Folsomia candida]|uniref:Protein XRP2 n=1 Tax=Folsomia candida TaxID=158441 RepID=A0A226EFM8_FOLCA|nr:protein XRP2 [Folsomia candida]OXA56058.1 Protein XRP2 [Folsomia candida]
MGSLISRCTSSCCCAFCQGSHRFKRQESFSGILTQTGQSCSANNFSSSSPLEITTQPKQQKQYSWDTRPKQDPANYTISDLRDGEQRVKRPGEINGQQFIIKNCTNSKIFMFDYSSQVTIDDCTDCLIVCGPVQGSLFLRDTKNSTLVCTSSQLRLRDCQNIHLFVATESDPIIEASTEIVVGPYFLSYNGLVDQFKSAKLDRSKATHWSEIYDFTPNDVTPNWKRYERGKHTPEKYICLPQPVNFYADLEIRLEDETTLVQANVILQD